MKRPLEFVTLLGNNRSVGFFVQREIGIYLINNAQAAIPSLLSFYAISKGRSMCL